MNKLYHLEYQELLLESMGIQFELIKHRSFQKIRFKPDLEESYIEYVFDLNGGFITTRIT